MARAITQDPETLLCALPPSAAELRAWGQQGADVAAAEGAALAWQRLLPALQSATGSPLSAMAHTLFQVWHLLGGRALSLLDTSQQVAWVWHSVKAMASGFTMAS